MFHNGCQGTHFLSETLYLLYLWPWIKLKMNQKSPNLDTLCWSSGRMGWALDIWPPKPDFLFLLNVCRILLKIFLYVFVDYIWYQLFLWRHTLIGLRNRKQKLIMLKFKQCSKFYCNNAYYMKWYCLFTNFIFCLLPLAKIIMKNGSGF